MSAVTPIRQAKAGSDLNDSLGKARAVVDLLFTIAGSDDFGELDSKTMVDALAAIIGHIDDASERARVMQS